MAEVFGEWRRAGSPCGGGLVLWLRDLVPGAGWGVLDHRGEPKVAYHHLRRALAPVAVWTTDEGLGGVGVHVANDRPEPLARAPAGRALPRLRAARRRGRARTLELAAARRRERDVEALLGRFVDASLGLPLRPAGAGPDRREPASGEATAAELLSQAFRFPAGRPARHEPAERARARGRRRRAGRDGTVRLRSRRRRLAYGVRVDAPGFAADDDAFCVEPGGASAASLLRPREPGRRAPRRGRSPRSTSTAASRRVAAGEPAMSASPPDAPALPRRRRPEPVFALFHAAAGRDRPAPAVLICPPFGWEDIVLLPQPPRLGRRTSPPTGHPTLRIDLPGHRRQRRRPARTRTASTPGRARSPAPPRWLRGDRRRARASRRSASGSAACSPCARWPTGAPIDELVLWAAPARGRALLRELRAFGRMEARAAADAGAPDEPGRSGPARSPRAATSMSAGDGRGARGARPDGRGRAAAPPAARAAARSATGSRRTSACARTSRPPAPPVTVAAGPGLRRDDRRAAGGAGRRARSSPPSRRGSTPAAPAAAPSARREPAPPRAGSIELDHGAERIRETPVTLDRLDRGAVRGARRAAPASAARSRRVLLNAGALRRTGPQPHVGRDRAALGGARRPVAADRPRGHRRLRRRPRRLADVAALYVPELVDQVRAVSTSSRRGACRGRFLLVGLCSGAYWSLHAALQDPRVAARPLLNPRALIWDPWVYARREGAMYRGAIARADTWRRIAAPRGRLRQAVRHRRRAAAARAPRALPAAGRLAARRRAVRGDGGDELDRAFDALRDRGASALLVFAGDEPLYADFGARAGSSAWIAGRTCASSTSRCPPTPIRCGPCGSSGRCTSSSTGRSRRSSRARSRAARPPAPRRRERPLHLGLRADARHRPRAADLHVHPRARLARARRPGLRPPRRGRPVPRVPGDRGPAIPRDPPVPRRAPADDLREPAPARRPGAVGARGEPRDRPGRRAPRGRAAPRPGRSSATRPARWRC